MAKEKSPKLTRQEREEVARWTAAAQTIARQQCRKFVWLQQETDAVSNYALTQLLSVMKRSEVLNPEAYLTRIIINRINDLGRQHKVTEARLQFFDYERPSKSGEPGGFPSSYGPMGGLSMDFIKKENRRVASLKVAAVIAIMPDAFDRELLVDRFYDDELTVTELAQMYGKTPNTMANYLQKILGGNGHVGAVAPVYQVIEKLQLGTASAFVKILQEFDNRDQLSDPIAGAISHLEFSGTYSDAHQQLAAKGIARLRWLNNRDINNRGLTNKLLKRLVKAACFYVHEVNDARHDQLDARGLQDDVSVLDAVYEVVREFQTK